MAPPPPRSPLFPAVVLAGVSLVAACGDDDNAPKSGGSDASTSSSTSSSSSSSSSSTSSSGSSGSDASSDAGAVDSGECPDGSDMPTPPCNLIK